ncbi:MAG: Crp/Fnr family transcriptional regulator [Chitinophagaceae bacterium]|nr:Crp/Fnr family transcriptional regulator [Chitinophagaceae bacterium]
MNNQPFQKNSAFAPKPDCWPLVEFISQFYPLREELVDFIISRTTFKKIPKGKFLLKPGEYCKDYYYIHRGILRSFIKYGNKEITIWINPEGEITTAIRSISGSRISGEYIQVIENADLVVIPFEAMAELYERFPEMNKVGRMLLEEYYAASEERVFIARIPNAEARYQHFLQSRPELLNRIPLKYVASYLGITLETLSRLRAKKTRRS